LCAVNVALDIPTYLVLIFGSLLGLLGVMRTVMGLIFGVWMKQRRSLSTWCVTTDALQSVTSDRSPSSFGAFDHEMVLPDSARITAAFFGYPVKNWRERIAEMKEKKKFLTMEEIREIFSKDPLFDVTDDVKYYLYQGATIFRVEEEKDRETILLVKGWWRGGRCDPGSNANTRFRYDAVQIINVSLSEDHSHLKWHKKQGRLSSMSCNEGEAGDNIWSDVGDVELQQLE